MSREATGARAARQRVKAKLVNLGAAASLVRNADLETYSKSHPYAETFVIQEGAEGGRRNSVKPGSAMRLRGRREASHAVLVKSWLEGF